MQATTLNLSATTKEVEERQHISDTLTPEHYQDKIYSKQCAIYCTLPYYYLILFQFSCNDFLTHFKYTEPFLGGLECLPTGHVIDNDKCISPPEVDRGQGTAEPSRRITTKSKEGRGGAGRVVL